MNKCTLLQNIKQEAIICYKSDDCIISTKYILPKNFFRKISVITFLTITYLPNKSNIRGEENITYIKND